MSQEQDSVKVNCSFCGSGIECPQDMLEKSEKHMCFECFQNPNNKDMPQDISKVHIDILKDKFEEVMPESITNSLINEAFPEIWSGRKEELKEMSKKELAEEMFGAGAYVAISSLIRLMKMEAEEEMKEDKGGMDK